MLIPSAGNKNPTSANSSANAPDPATAPYQTLEDFAMQFERVGDWASARRYAEKALARFPQQPYAYSVLAFIDAHDHRADQAIAGYQAEIASHPDDRSEIVRLLAAGYMSKKRYAEAITLLKSYSSRKDPALQTLLSYAQSVSGDYEGALISTRDALSGKPGINGSRQRKRPFSRSSIATTRLRQQHSAPSKITAILPCSTATPTCWPK